MRIAYAILPVLCALAAAVSTAEDTQSEVVPVELYQGPKVSQWANMRELQDARFGGSGGSEGWVIVNLMVDPAGKPYEVTVAESNGNPVFEQAALVKVERSRFEPATLNGTPIHAGTTLKLEFRNLNPGWSSMSPAFAKRSKKVLEAIEAGDRALADSRLAQLRAYNLYEDAYEGVARYAYNRRWGTEAQQLGALRRAIAGERDALYLTRDAYDTALQSVLTLEIRAQDFASALRTWETLSPRLDAATRQKWRKSIDEIQSLRDNDTAYTVAGDFADRSSWQHELLKRRLRIDVDSGSIAEVKLRCDQQYVFFHFDPTLQYTISGSNKHCSMELVGQPGTKFRLTQS
jgi:TonB family protein